MLYDVALIEKPLDDGLTKENVMDLFDMLNGYEALPIEVQGACSAAMGFITVPAAEQLDYYLDSDSAIASYLSLILNDMNKESENGFYEFEGLNIWMSRNIEEEES